MADSDRGAHLPSENPFARPRGVDAVLDHWLSSNRVKPCLTADDVRALSAEHQPSYVMDRVDRLIPPAAWDELGWTDDNWK